MKQIFQTSALSKVTQANGFTLIELIIVIVILGILSVIAAPRFINLSDEAHIAVLESISGVMKSTASLHLAKSAVDGKIDIEYSSRLVDDQTISLFWGQPTKETFIAALNTDAASDLSASIHYQIKPEHEVVLTPSYKYSSVPTVAQILATNCYVAYHERLPSVSYATVAFTETVLTDC